VSDELTQALTLYEDAVFRGDREATGKAHGLLDGLEAGVRLARGRIRHAEFLAGGDEDPSELDDFETAVRLYEALGDARGEAESRFWVGTFHQVVRKDTATALPYFERSYALARDIGDRLTMSYAVRHLGFADLAEGRFDDARAKLTESLKLRREVGVEPGVAAAILGLAQLADEEGRSGDVPALLDEAEAVARACGANGILRWIDEARAEHT
jgi:tetratricopeptide (TPR) repeat protein